MFLLNATFVFLTYGTPYVYFPHRKINFVNTAEMFAFSMTLYAMKLIGCASCAIVKARGTMRGAYITIDMECSRAVTAP